MFALSVRWLLVAGAVLLAAVPSASGRGGAWARAADSAPYLIPQPIGPPPLGAVDIATISNGCGGGPYASLVKVQNLLGDSSTYRNSLNPFGTRYTVDFRPACNLHDAGYSGAYVWDAINGRWYDAFDRSKAEIDTKFLLDMQKLCEKQIPADAPEALRECKSTGEHLLDGHIPANGAESRYNFVRDHGVGFRVRPVLSGQWTNTGCSLGNWTFSQAGRTIHASWQEPPSSSGAPGYSGSFTGTLFSYDPTQSVPPPRPDVIEGTYTVTKGSAPAKTYTVEFELSASGVPSHPGLVLDYPNGHPFFLTPYGRMSFDSTSTRHGPVARSTQSASLHACAAPPATTTPSAAPEEYGVYLMTNVEDNVFVGPLSAIKGAAACSFTDGGLCSGSTNPSVVYTTLFGPYSSCAEARAAYSKAAADPHSAYGGTKVYIGGNSYFTDNASTWCGGGAPPANGTTTPSTATTATPTAPTATATTGTTTTAAPTAQDATNTVLAILSSHAQACGSTKWSVSTTGSAGTYQATATVEGSHPGTATWTVQDGNASPTNSLASTLTAGCA